MVRAKDQKIKNSFALAAASVRKLRRTKLQSLIRAESLYFFLTQKCMKSHQTTVK